MEKLKNFLYVALTSYITRSKTDRRRFSSPGHKEDDAKMYAQDSSNITGDISNQAKNTPGASHPKPTDDPSKVSQ